MRSTFIALTTLAAAILSATHASPIVTLNELTKRDTSATIADGELPVFVSRTIKDEEKPLLFEEAYTTPGGTHVKKGGFYDPTTGSRGSYSSSSFHKEWHSP
ncbi:uncharacterized protein FA14DRAFT_159383 [Meira miltonrushii]|uniref:Uncharacterized protein n=1 Tax=Meira miltonrushii TaxID=1280837 RepID=A0A316VI24_9BASI|nr:uncharacterized protein FA14DRAFT_159383 [Meira miltonrushii]PWN37242.1 hypothetical protein FA14DRAFT_159383 [Meira miltonrushii]